MNRNYNTGSGFVPPNIPNYNNYYGDLQQPNTWLAFEANKEETEKREAQKQAKLSLVLANLSSWLYFGFYGGLLPAIAGLVLFIVGLPIYCSYSFNEYVSEVLQTYFTALSALVFLVCLVLYLLTFFGVLNIPIALISRGLAQKSKRNPRCVYGEALLAEDKTKPVLIVSAATILGVGMAGVGSLFILAGFEWLGYTIMIFGGILMLPSIIIFSGACSVAAFVMLLIQIFVGCICVALGGEPVDLSEYVNILLKILNLGGVVGGLL